MRRSLKVAVASTVFSTAITWFSAGNASAAARNGALAPSSIYVVASVPLTNLSTNTSSWNYGYVQLWYNTATRHNWARVVFLLGNATDVYAELDRSDGAAAWADSHGTSGAFTPDNETTGLACDITATIVCSRWLHSPVLKDSAYGGVAADGVHYEATTGYY
jgi:hypothetical protein